jgi:hypothetical protein
MFSSEKGKVMIEN